MPRRPQPLLALAALAGYPSLRRLAVAAQLDRETVTGLARGGRRASRRVLQRLADALEVSPAMVERALAEGCGDG